MSERLKVLHTVCNLGVGGLERLVYEMSSRMADDGIDVEVCCIDKIGEFGEKLQKRGISVTVAKKDMRNYGLNYVFRLRSFIQSRRPDIVHMHSGTYFWAGLAAAFARVPVRIYTDHGRALVDTKRRMFEDRIVTRLTPQVVAVSDELKDYLVDVVGLPRKKITTIINGVNTELFTRREKSGEILAEFGIAPDAPVVGAVGRMRKVKNHAGLIRAFALVRAEIPAAALVIVGDGPRRGELEELARAEGVEEAVVFAGLRGDMPEILNIFDVNALPSFSEGTSVSLLEAMATGLPSVVSNVGGNPSLIEHETHGLLVPPDDDDALATALTRTLRDAELRKRLGKKAAEKVRARFSQAAMVASYLDLYGQWLERKGRSAAAEWVCNRRKG